MTPRLTRSFAGLLGVAALLSMAAPARAGVIAAGDIGIEIFVSGTSIARQIVRQGEGGVYGLNFRQEGQEYLIQGAMSVNPDPVIEYDITANNFTGAPLALLFAFFSPYVGGPFNTLDSSHSSIVTDSGPSPSDLVVVSPTDPSGFVHVPHIDTLPVPGANLGVGCTVNPPGPFGGSAACDAASLASVSVGPTGASGFFDVFVGITLSPGDIWIGNGRMELRNEVPEPLSLALLGLGLGAVVLVCRRRA